MSQSHQKVAAEQLGFAQVTNSTQAGKANQNAPASKQSQEGGAKVPWLELDRKDMAPMLRQYLDTKEEYPEHVLLFQVGDFYEVFFDDAEIVASALQIRLTSRDKNKKNPIPMCGVPQHAIDNYIPKLLAQGLSCVMVSQLEDARHAKGMVKRGVTRIVTPGVRYDGDGLDAKRFNYLASVLSAGGSVSAVSYIDISTGRLRIQEVESSDEACEVLQRLAPSEVVLPLTINGAPVEKSGGWLKSVAHVSREIGSKIVYRPFDFKKPEEVLKTVETWLVELEGTTKPSDTISAISPLGLSSLGAALSYVEEVTFGCQPVLSHFGLDEVSKTVVVDAATRRNLELTETRIDGERKNSLIQHIDFAKTAMGSRQLREWILTPSTEKAVIESRHNAIEELQDSGNELARLRELFVGVRDIERLCSRVSGRRANPRDLGILLESIQHFSEIGAILANCTSDLLSNLSQQFDAVPDIRERLESALIDEPPLRSNEGGIFRTGFHSEIDRLRGIRADGKSWLAKLEAKEKAATGISGLKIKYNNVFGYFIEVSKANSAKVPDHYERKQTLVNAERYITDELKERESEILSAKVRQFDLERDAFSELRDWLSDSLARLQRTSLIVSTLDVICSMAQLAKQYNYVKPIISETNQTVIVGGRHPVVERILGAHNFIPNDSSLDAQGERLAILTGPNMGGKSTYLRQVGLIQLLAQAGSYVPAERAELGLVDRIFTRIGAADDLSRGDSTFMVEMREASTIIRKASASSLVLIDEIGRGTATSDGLALALSIAEWLHDTTACRTIFATHFHELTRLVGQKNGACCLAVGIIEKADEIIFTHRIERRVAEKSFGLEVAKLAGLPEQLILRARDLLEKPPSEEVVVEKEIVPPRDPMSDKIVRRVQNIDPNNMTPFDALNELVRLKKMLEGELESDE